MSKTALVTGASAGIGYELAKVCARNRFNLVVTARREDKLEELKKQFEEYYHIRVHVVPIDLMLPGAAQSLWKNIEANDIKIDMLINNAGFGDYGLFHHSALKKQVDMIGLNVTALTELTHLALSGMIERKYGKVMNVASTAAFLPGPLMSVYFATKAYVLSFSEALSNELRGTGVTITTLCPGPTRSEFQAAAGIENAKFIKGRPLATSEQVAEYGFRAMMAGQVIAVEGFVNRALAALVRFFPRVVIRQLVRRQQEMKVKHT